ncbi:glycosyltransferase family 39 protein [Chryseobacterium limigenitum]|nr:glycosyltransferase family 39 protein [Chryseobacterium limigenitum]
MTDITDNKLMITKPQINNKEIIIALIILLSRIPFIFNSLGQDLDGWREVYSGKILSEYHIYNVSRFPGYPFPEFVFSLFYKQPYWYLNSLSILFTMGACIFFYRILEYFKVSLSFLLAVSLSFIPIIYLNSTVVMDYNWSLFFMLGSLYFILIKKKWAAVIFFGLMISCRLNNAIFLPAFTFIAYFQLGKNLKETIIFSVLLVLSAIFFFLPVIVRYEGDFLHSYGTESVSLFSLFSLSTLYVYGAIGTLGILASLVMQFFTDRFKNIQLLLKDYFIVFCFLMIFINFIFFVKFPLESGYLIPSIPFILIILQRILSDKLMKFALFSLLISPFLIHINTKKVHIKGSIFMNENYEDQELQYCKILIQKIKSTPENSVIHVGNFYEQLVLMGNFDFKKVKLINNLSQENIKSIKKGEKKLYYLETPNSDEENEKTHLFDEFGILLYPKFELAR